jgi:hypothetical protein
MWGSLEARRTLYVRVLQNIESRKQAGCGENSSTDRTRLSITNSLKKKLKELMGEFQALRQKFQDEYKEVVERRIYTGQTPTAQPRRGGAAWRCTTSSHDRVGLQGRREA